MATAEEDELQRKMSKLQESIRHLKEALARDGFDHDYQDAVGENCVALARCAARLDELRTARGAPAGEPDESPRLEPAAPMQVDPGVHL